MSVYDDVLKELADEAGPDPAQFDAARAKITAHLDQMSADTIRYVLKDIEIAWKLVNAYILTHFGENSGVRAIKAQPAEKALVLESRKIGRGSGEYMVTAVWLPHGADLYIYKWQGNLRSEASIPERE